MTAGWVAGSVRAAALARRRADPALVRAVATSPDLSRAVRLLAPTPYGPSIAADGSLADVERSIAVTLLWHARVLAGWLPAPGAEMVRVLAGWFEIANIDEQLRALTDRGRTPPPPFRLGSLKTGWPRMAGIGSTTQLRAALAASPWGDPGVASADAIALWLRLSWAHRVSRGVPAGGPWALGAAALLVARERFVAQAPLTGRSAELARQLLGRGCLSTPSLGQFRVELPPAAGWVLAGVGEPEDLWRAEQRWWARLHRDGMRLLRQSELGPQRPLGAIAVLAADAWQITGALERAARGAGEVPDAAS